jgi:hypothetical protein
MATNLPIGPGFFIFFQDIDQVIPEREKVKIMTTLNKNEYGTVLYADLKDDISAATALNFVLRPKVGDKKEFTGVLGAVDVTVDDESYTANEYMTYTLLDGDLDQSGLWQVKGEATMTATKVIYGDYKHISVLE